MPLGSTDLPDGAGVYAIYYCGTFPAYAVVRCDTDPAADAQPIYVGKAIPKGGRKGGLGLNAAQSSALRNRLRKHAASINECRNLELADFRVRLLVVDDIWIPPGENILIDSYKPVWNLALDGFGKNDPGTRRKTQFRSPWDVVHPGRAFAEKLAMSPASHGFLLARIGDFLAGRPLQALP